MTWQRTMTEALLRGSDRQLYETNATFYHNINQLVAMLPSFVDGLAETAKLEDEKARRSAHNVTHGIVEPARRPDYILAPTPQVHKRKENKCECDEPMFSTSDEAKPSEAWWRCLKCHGLLWMGSAPENMEEAPFRWPNMHEWLADHLDATELPRELRPDRFTSSWVSTKNGVLQFFVDTNGRVRWGDSIR